jgi:hypothetical protein
MPQEKSQYSFVFSRIPQDRSRKTLLCPENNHLLTWAMAAPVPGTHRQFTTGFSHVIIMKTQ